MSGYYLLTALLVAIGVYIRSRARAGELRPVGLIRWLLPKEVLAHPSAMTDYGYFFASKILMAAIYSTVFIGTAIWHQLTAELLVAVFGPAGPGVEPSHWMTLLCTLILLIVLDISIWWSHYLFHVVPILWEFHKVHHSAEVMTPITATRLHPVEQIFGATVVAFSAGVTLGALKYAFGPSAMMFSVFEINIFLAVFFLVAFNLRHSHVWLCYPAWLQHIFISPAQHQIHHSTAPQHWDRNLGFIFSVWDWLAGTLYVAKPKQEQELTFGLGTEEDGSWRGVSTLFVRPFRQSWQVLIGRAPGRKANLHHPSRIEQTRAGE